LHHKGDDQLISQIRVSNNNRMVFFSEHLSWTLGFHSQWCHLATSEKDLASCVQVWLGLWIAWCTIKMNVAPVLGQS
jgi:hypothetical protein